MKTKTRRVHVKRPRIQRRRRKKQSRAIVLAPRKELTIPEAIEKVLIIGDLSSLTAEQRIDYYRRMCRTLSLNPLTQPFTYILFKEYGSNAPAKLSLYANKSCSEQLRKIHGVSIKAPLRREIKEEICMVEADASDKAGRTDSASGSVALYKFKDGKRLKLDGVELCNSIMKAETKAKRRVTLSICGLALLDESELDGVEVLGRVGQKGEIIYEHPDYTPAGRQIVDDRGFSPSGKAATYEARHEQAQAVGRAKAEELRRKMDEQAKTSQEPGKATSKYVEKVQEQDRQNRIVYLIRTRSRPDVRVMGFLDDPVIQEFLATINAEKMIDTDNDVSWRFAEEHVKVFEKTCGDRKITIERVGP